MRESTHRRRVAEALLIFVALGWGLGFPLMKLAVAEHSVFMVLWLRFVLAALLMLPFCLRRQAWSWRTLGVGVWLGALLFGSFALLIAGLQRTSAANTGMLSGLAVVWVPLFSWLVLRQRIGAGPVIGVICCLLGIWVMSGVAHPSLNIGDGCVVLGSLFTALHILSIDRLAKPFHSAALTAIQLLTVALLAWLTSCFTTSATLSSMWEWRVLVIVLITAVLSTAFAFWVQTRFQHQTTPTRAVIIFNLEPAFATLFAWLLLREAVGLSALIACGLIIAGMTVSELLPRKPRCAGTDRS